MDIDIVNLKASFLRFKANNVLNCASALYKKGAPNLEVSVRFKAIFPLFIAFHKTQLV